MFRVIWTFALTLSLYTVASALVDRASLSGTVNDPSGVRVPDAIVVVASSATGLRRETKTSTVGGYQVPGLPVGNYVVSINKCGFNPIRFESVALEVGQARTLDAQFSVGTVGTVATALEITASGTVIGEEQIKNIPLNGRR